MTDAEYRAEQIRLNASFLRALGQSPQHVLSIWNANPGLSLWDFTRFRLTDEAVRFHTPAAPRPKRKKVKPVDDGSQISINFNINR